MWNGLFNQSLSRKYSQNFNLTHKQKELVREYVQQVENGLFKGETRNYLKFYDLILKGLLGYGLENVCFDEKMDDGVGRSEFVLKSCDKKFMVVELKGQGIDLDKPQNRVNDKRSPVDQAFGYAIHTGDVEWILLSNYNEFRLYNYYRKTHYISFKASDLLDNDILKCFLLVFSKKSHITEGYVDKLMEKTLIVERKLESEFYKLYNETRLMIIKELEHTNGFSRVEAVHYAQLILNRYIFICFAEDLGLLPGQITIDTIHRPIRFRDLRGDEIWHRLNGLFLDIRDGNSERKVYPYDGVLFDEDLKDIQIRDLIEDSHFFRDTYQKWKFEGYDIDIQGLITPYGDSLNPVYKNLLRISQFDFASDLDVNILGHIFENSIGDLEDLKKDTRGRRKKDGIYYTPEYITDYICRNTILPYLSKSGEANTVKTLIDEYYGSGIEELDQKVKEIKIVDPACGSGAFLNKAADVLLEIHQAIHKKKYKDKQDLSPFFDNINQRREILLNNIYGVDLNPESVEITKLSLFLKVCRKDLKLPNLDNNIKCGNSLIDDPEYTDKPFHWEGQFEEGKFDIVIGNPPYVFGGNQGLSKKDKKFFKDKYLSGTQKTNLFTLFIEKGTHLLSKNGILSYIIPNTLLRVTSYKNIREFLVRNTIINEIIDLDVGIFENVTASTIIIFLTKNTADLQNSISIKRDLSSKPYNQIKQEEFNNKGNVFNIFSMPNERKIIKKMRTNSLNLGQLSKYIRFGVVISKNKDDIVSYHQNNNWKPFLEGKEIGKYSIKYSGRYLNYEKELLHRSRTTDLFESRKIMIQRITGGEKPIKATYDNSNFYNKESVINLILNENNIDYKYILSLLNSNLINWFYNKEYSNESKLTVNLSKEYLSEIPIINISLNEQKPFIELADQMLQLNNDLMCEVNGFKEWLQRTFYIDKFSKKLDKYYELSFDEFLVELKKKKIDVNSRKTQELLKSEFNGSVEKIKPLQGEIEVTDKKIDNMVYGLYGLTESEIRIVEDSFK